MIEMMKGNAMSANRILTLSLAGVVAIALFALSVISFWEPGLSGATRAVATAILVALLGFGGTLWVAEVMATIK